MVGAQMKIGPSAQGYSVDHRDGCVLIFGSVPLNDFVSLSRQAGRNAIMSPELAQVAGANIAFGEPENVARLTESLKPAAIERAKALYKDAGLSENVIHWIATGHRGQSSEAMLSCLVGNPIVGISRENSHPMDTADFIRCRLLLEAAPEIAAHFDRLELLSPEWKRIVQAWPEICFAIDEEAPEWRQNKGSSPTANELIRKCIGHNNSMHP